MGKPSRWICDREFTRADRFLRIISERLIDADLISATVRGDKRRNHLLAADLLFELEAVMLDFFHEGRCGRFETEICEIM